MSAPRFGRFQKATALLPLALLSTAVTASLAGVGRDHRRRRAAGAGHAPRRHHRPDRGRSRPRPASRPPAPPPATSTARLGREVARPRPPPASRPPRSRPTSAPRPSSTPPTSRATSRGSCSPRSAGSSPTTAGLNGNTLDDEGLATPGIYGIALNGKNNTQAISDTDAGQYDADARWDRAVGPMQFIPSTWSVVGVDGDNDGKRNPQDIDDAALASAVYLCSGKDDLATERRPARLGLPLQPQRRVRRPGAVVHGRLHSTATTPRCPTASAAPATSRRPRAARAARAAATGRRRQRLRHHRWRRRSGGRRHGRRHRRRRHRRRRRRRWRRRRRHRRRRWRRRLPDPDDVPDPTLPPVEDVLTEAEATAQCLADWRQL